jgi:hypothetical protein
MILVFVRPLASPDNHGIDIAAWPDFEDSDQG